jgi:hypothetical protein
LCELWIPVASCRTALSAGCAGFFCAASGASPATCRAKRRRRHGPCGRCCGAGPRDAHRPGRCEKNGTADSTAGISETTLVVTQKIANDSPRYAAMKKWAIWILILILLLAVCMPAQAAPDADIPSVTPTPAPNNAQTGGGQRAAASGIAVAVVLIVASALNARRDRHNK